MLRLFLAFVFATTLTSFSATSFASEAEAERQAHNIARRMVKIGYNVRQQYSTGVLKQGKAYIIRTSLYRGVKYVLAGAGDSAARDIDVEVYDENFNLVARDQESTPVAAVEVVPRWTGTFYIVVKMYRAAGGAAHWVLVTGHK